MDIANQTTVISLIRRGSPMANDVAIASWESQALEIGWGAAMRSDDRILGFFQDMEKSGGLPGVCFRGVEKGADGKIALVEASSVFSPVGERSVQVPGLGMDDLVRLARGFADYLDEKYPGRDLRPEMALCGVFVPDEASVEKLRSSIGRDAFDCLSRWSARSSVDWQDDGVDSSDKLYGLAGIMARVSLTRDKHVSEENTKAGRPCFAMDELFIADGTNIEAIHHLIPGSQGEQVVVPSQMSVQPDERTAGVFKAAQRILSARPDFNSQQAIALAKEGVFNPADVGSSSFAQALLQQRKKTNEMRQARGYNRANL